MQATKKLMNSDNYYSNTQLMNKTAGAICSHSLKYKNV